jgi:hypothetical protein
VQINGATATARVKGVNGGKKSVQTMTFAKEGGRWRISGVS